MQSAGIIASAGLLSGGSLPFNQKAGPPEISNLDNIRKSVYKVHPQRFNMCGYAAPKLEKVRIGFIGLGHRGPSAVERMCYIEGVEITSICDINPKGMEVAQAILSKHGLPAAKEYSGSEDAWKGLCESNDVDLVYIATPWRLHTPISVYAMEHGKHVGVEVPAAVTVDEAWQLVETSERTKKHCMMLENVCYGFFQLLVLNMSRQGFFGEIIHYESGYIHDLVRSDFSKTTYFRPWRIKENFNRNGNLYPTHQMGPGGQLLNINRGDKMEYLTSMSSNDFTRGKLASELAKKDEYYKEYATGPHRGNMNVTLIRTNKGKSIQLQHDVSSPRPQGTFSFMSGTDGFAQTPWKIGKNSSFLNDNQIEELKKKYNPKILRLVGEMAEKIGGHGGGDFLMDWRLIDCLRNGIPLDQDVYDAALWSVISPLSEWSVANRSNSIDIPDFSNGAWKTNEPLDINLSLGGNTQVRSHEGDSSFQITF